MFAMSRVGGYRQAFQFQTYLILETHFFIPLALLGIWWVVRVPLEQRREVSHRVRILTGTVADPQVLSVILRSIVARRHVKDRSRQVASLTHGWHERQSRFGGSIVGLCVRGAIAVVCRVDEEDRMRRG